MSSPIEESIRSKKRNLALGVIERRVRFLKNSFFSANIETIQTKKSNSNFINWVLGYEPNSHIDFSKEEKDEIIKVLDSIVDLVDKL